MPNVNNVVVAGHLTRDVELRHIASGTAVADLGLAISDRRKNAAGEWVEETTFVDVTLWGRTAEIAAEYLQKGSAVLITGKLKLESWEKDGQKRSKLKIVADNLQFLDGKGKGEGGGSSSGGSARGLSSSSTTRRGGRYQPCSQPDGSVSEDEIPF